MRIARRTGAEILSVDSMQIYRRMDIGTAKPSPADRSEVRHHMIDVADPADSYSVAEFRAGALRAVESCERPLLITGGSGLHFRAVVDPLDFGPTDRGVRVELEGEELGVLVAELLQADPEAGSHVDLDNQRRVVRAVEILRLSDATPSARATTSRASAVRSYESERPVVAVGLDPGDALPGRVVQRFDQMIEDGLQAEVEGLMHAWGPTASQAVGYRETARVVAGEWDAATGRRRAIDATTSLARRQRTFFRRDPRIEWLKWDDDPDRTAVRALERLEEAGWTS